MSFYSGAKVLVRIVLTPFFRLEVTGLEHVPQGRGHLVACNHVSDWDPVMLGLACPNQVRYMAKEELFRIPVLSFLIRKLGAFPVARGKGDTGAIQTAVDIVREGGVLGIFPEGGRSRDGQFHKLKSGAVVVASQTGGDILPAAVQYGKWRLFRRRVTLAFGPVIRNEDLQITQRTKSELRAANALLAEGIARLLGVPAP